MMSTRQQRRRAAALLFLACGTGLAACSENRIMGEPYDATRSHPFVTDVSQQAQAIRVDGDDVQLDAGAGVGIDGFVDDFLRHGGGVLDITVGRDPADDADLRRSLATLQAQLRRRGVRGDEIRISRAPVEAGASDTIVLSYLRYQARAIDCGNQPTGSGFNPRNLSHPDYGCSLQANIAASVANPADLERPRRRQPADATRRSLVLESYRSGEATGRERGEGEQASSIEQLIQ